MSTQVRERRRTTLQQVLLIAGILLIAANLRPALSAVGPLLGDIRRDTGLSNTLLGMLTTLPLLAFGVMSSLASVISRKIGIESTLAGAMVILTAGILTRVIELPTALFGGTLLIGIGIALGNVLLPGLVKRDFSEKAGIMISTYSSVLGIGSAVAAGLSVPMAEDLGLGWRWSLGSWALLSIIAFVVWLPQLRDRTIDRDARGIIQALNDLGRKKLAWKVALFMGLQSLTFYVVLTWLPEILQNQGMKPHHAGYMLSLSQGMGIFGTLLVPAMGERMKNQRIIVWILISCEMTGLVGLLLMGNVGAPFWVSIIGFALGGNFGLALLFIVLRTARHETAAELSGMAQSIGYLLAATGPTFFGFLHDFTTGWVIPLLVLMGIVIIKMMMGLSAGRDAVIE